MYTLISPYIPLGLYANLAISQFVTQISCNLWLCSCFPQSTGHQLGPQHCTQRNIRRNNITATYGGKTVEQHTVEQHQSKIQWNNTEQHTAKQHQSRVSSTGQNYTESNIRHTEQYTVEIHTEQHTPELHIEPGQATKCQKDQRLCEHPAESFAESVELETRETAGGGGGRHGRWRRGTPVHTVLGASVALVELEEIVRGRDNLL